MKKLCLAAVVGLGLVGVALAKTTQITEDMTAAGDWNVEVESGDTVEVTVEQTGSGKIVKTGAGTLTLKVDNSFTGGVVIQTGRVRAEADAALGASSGTVTICGQTEDYTGICELDLVGKNVGAKVYTATLTIANPIHVTGTTTLSYPAIRGYYQNIFVNGKITADADLAIVDDVNSTKEIYSSTYDRYGSVRLFNFEDIEVAGTFWHSGMCAHYFNGKLKAGAINLPHTTNNYNARYYFKGGVECAGDCLDVHRCFQIQSDFTVGGVMGFGEWDTRCFFQVSSGKKVTVGALESPDAGGSQNYWEINYNATSSSDRPLKITGVGTDPTEKVTSMIVEGLMSITIDAYKGFTQTFKDRVHTSTKPITVTKGAMKLTGTASFKKVAALTVGADGAFIDESTADGALSGVTSLTLDGSFSSVGQPLTDGAVDLVLGTDAELSIGADANLQVKTLTVGGVAKPVGNYTSGKLPQLKSGRITVLTGPSASVEDVDWTAGGADDLRASTAKNWSDYIDLADGNYRPHFATAGSVAEIDADANFSGLRFKSSATATGFTVRKHGAAGSIALMEASIAIEDEDDDLVATYSLDLPVTRVADDLVKLTIPTNKTLVFTEYTSPGKLEIVGKGTLRLDGTNFVDGYIHVPTDAVARISGLLAPRDRKDQGTGLDQKFKTTLQVLTKGNRRPGILLDNCTIEKPIYINGETGGDMPIRALANTTNVISGDVRYHSSGWSGFYLEENSETVLQGGFHRSGAALRNFGPGTLIVRKTGITPSYSTGFELNDGRVVFEVGGNGIEVLGAGYYVDANVNPTVEFKASNVFSAGSKTKLYNGCSYNSGFSPSSGIHGLMELHSTTQTVHQLVGSSAAVFRGDAGSRIDIIGNQDDTAQIKNAANIYIAAKIEGSLSLQMGGTGTMLLKSQDFATTGDLIVTNGVLELAANASWANGANVIVSGNGCLKLNAKQNLSKTVTKLQVSESGTVDIAAGVRVTVAEAWVGGVKLADGVYVKSDANPWLAGEGSLRVGQTGLVLIMQ